MLRSLFNIIHSIVCEPRAERRKRKSAVFAFNLPYCPLQRTMDSGSDNDNNLAHASHTQKMTEENKCHQLNSIYKRRR